MTERSGFDADVLVVGAGLAGLTAAAQLQRASARVITLEAQAEVGGRTRSRVLAGEVFDLGGEFIGPHHRRARELARELSIPLHRSGLRGSRTLWRIDRRQRVGYLPRLSPSELTAMVGAVAALARLARSVPPEKPWEAPDASALDGVAFSQWLDRRGVRGRPRALIAAMLEGLATTRLERLSSLQVVWWIARAGGPIAALRDANAMRVSGGAQQLCVRLAERLREPVRLSTPATRIRQDDVGVTVESGHGAAWRARQTIVCVPMPALRQIEFAPALDRTQHELIREISFGRGTTVVVATPGSRRTRHRLVVGGDSLPLAWRTDGGAKGVFLDSGPAQDAVDRRVLVDQLSAAFDFGSGSDRAEIVRWVDEPFIGGTYVAFEPGQLTRHGPDLGRSHGRIEFAGAERSSWPNNMEGAVESGVLAAERVAEALSRR